MDIAINFLKALSAIRTPFLDVLLQLVTRLGEELVVIGVICVLYWCVNKESAYKLGMIFFASGMLVQGLKVSFRIERPWVIDPSFSPVESARAGATGYSFPSGHTQGATALYGYFAVNSKKRVYKILLFLIIPLVMFSRMYLGVHTFYDVLAAFALTLIAVILINELYARMVKGERDIITACVLGGISIAVCVYSYILARAGIIDMYQINDCFKSGGAGVGFAIGFYLERRYVRFDTRTPHLWQQPVKLIIGVAGALLFKELIKLIAPGKLVIDFIRYLVTVLWVLVVYPMIIKKSLKVK